MAKTPTIEPAKTAEVRRLDEAREKGVPWRQWGPYLSERQWGTVRENYSSDGNAWDYFSHDQARSRAYHWGEDGSQVSVMIASGCVLRWRRGTQGPDTQGAGVRADQ
jgi:hypothetical protein